jgi:hypothetical protein
MFCIAIWHFPTRAFIKDQRDGYHDSCLVNNTIVQMEKGREMEMKWVIVCRVKIPGGNSNLCCLERERKRKLL